MTTPTNCLKCPERHIQGGIMPYATHLYCKAGANQWVASWRTKERKMVRPTQWCPLRYPASGQRVRVVSSGENTCHYEAAGVNVPADEYARLVRVEQGLRRLADWCEERGDISVYAASVALMMRDLLKGTAPEQEGQGSE